MLFRNKDGKVVEINPFHYANDLNYNKKVFALKKEFLNNQPKAKTTVLEQLGEKQSNGGAI